MKRFKSGLIVLTAAVGLLGTTGVAQAHSQKNVRSNHSHSVTVNRAFSPLQIVARLPIGSVRVALHGQDYYFSAGRYYSRANRGWNVVEAPSRSRAAKRNERERRDSSHRRNR